MQGQNGDKAAFLSIVDGMFDPEENNKVFQKMPEYADCEDVKS